MTFALLLGVPLLLGAAAAAALGIRRGSDTLLWAAWCWALGCLGTAVLVLLSWALGLAARPGAGPGWIAAAALLAAALLAWAARRRSGAGPRPPPGPWTRAAHLERGLFWLVLAAALASALDRMLVGSADAVSLGDEAHVWAGKAKAMYFAGGPGEGLATLAGRGYVTHADQPLLDPLLHLWTYAVAGRVVHVENRLCIQLFAVAALCVLAAGLRRRVRPAVAAGLLLLVASAGPLGEILGAGGGGGADGMVLAGATLALDAWLRQRDGEGGRWLWLWGLALSLCAWSKNDGLWLAAAFAAAALASRVPRRRLALALLPVAAVVLFTWGFNAAHGFQGELLQSGGMPFWERATSHLGERAAAVSRSFARALFLDPGSSRLLWVAAMLFALASPRRLLGERLRTPALFLVLALAGYALAFLGTPPDIDLDLRAAAAGACYHVLPGAALWVAAAAAELFPGRVALAPGDTRALGRARVPVRKLAFLAASLVLALPLGELAVRLLTDDPVYMKGQRDDARLGWRERANVSMVDHDERGEFAFVLNAEGFRGPLLPAPGSAPPEGTRRILFVGDSFLIGWSVRYEDLMPQAAAQALAERGVAAEVYSVGSGGYGTGQELMLLREYGERVSPDAVVLELFPSNDLPNNTIELAGRSEHSPGDYVRPYLVPDEDGDLRSTWTHPLRAFLRHRSQAFAYAEIGLYLNRRLGPWGEPHPWPFPPPDPPGRCRKGLLPYEYTSFLIEPEPGSPWACSWTTTQALLKAFRRESEALGARFLVLVVPDHYQVQRDTIYLHEDQMSREIGGIAIDDVLDWNLPERKLAAFCRDEGIEARFMLEPLREALRADPARALFLIDGHFAGRAHVMAGREAANWFAGAPAGGGASPSPAWTAEALTAPVEHLRELGALARWNDFRSAPNDHVLGHGWKGWLPEFFGGEGGWITDHVAMAALPASGSPVMVRASLPAAASFPVEVTLEIPYEARAQKVVEGPGPFEIVLEQPSPPKSDTDYVLINLRTDRTFTPPGATPIGLVVHALGFQDAAPAPDE